MLASGVLGLLCPMNWPTICLILTVIFGVTGGTCLLAGLLSLNTVAGRQSKDGRTFIEKRLSGEWKIDEESQQEACDAISDTWANQRVTRWLVYLGLTFIVLARVLWYWAAPTR